MTMRAKGSIHTNRLGGRCQPQSGRATSTGRAESRLILQVQAIGPLGKEAAVQFNELAFLFLRGFERKEFGEHQLSRE